MDKKIPVTQETYDQLVAEWNKLKKIDRPRVVDELEEARKQGDLSENAEYHAAKEMLAKIDARLPVLEDQISSAQIIAFDSNSATIKFGATVTVRNLKTKKELVYQLVSPEGVHVFNGKISFKSPLGAALIGKTRGDVVEYSTPKGINRLEILDYK